MSRRPLLRVSHHALGGAAGLLAFGLLCGGLWTTSSAEAKPRAPSPAVSGGCRLQKAEKALKRSSFVQNRILSPALHQRAVRTLVERYGHIDTEATRSINPSAARKQAVTVKFMGLPVSVHSKIAPALACVERRIRKVCNKGRSRYTPRAIGGFRDANTYRGGEVSNHLFGVAIDIDPDRNPCCGCVDPWPNHPACKDTERTAFERAALPKCWVTAFERYGFHWLGRDELEDTMHFEFLGNPDRIRP